jgi:hypothetical protein
MLNIIKNIGSLTFLITILLLVGCKEDNKSESAEESTSNSKNETTALKGTPATDISDIFQFKQDQFIPEQNNAFYLRSLNAFKIYVQGSEDGSSINFNENDVIALFHEKTDKEVNFKVESFDNTGEDTKIEVSTIVTDNVVEPYRPSFIIKIPKKDVKGRPLVRLNGKIASVTAAE